MIETRPVRHNLIFPLNTEKVSLAVVGGKGINLVRMVQAGFPVPHGFLVTTQAYRDFIRDNQLWPQIQSVLKEIPAKDPNALETGSERIRAMFSSSKISPEINTVIQSAYEGLDCAEVAVRSSATAEDLPGMSFAGQQDTYLNVIGSKNLLQAVRDCWSSLWTARAIGYRRRNGIPQDSVELAVVVQCMVASEVSGVLFTANPLTGLRSETVVEATFGLGEALVSGQVEPDRYVVNTIEEEILSRALGAKAVSVRGLKNGGTQVIHKNASTIQALSDVQILRLAEISRQIVELYSEPQDIEWALVEDKFSLLQTRPITSLYPIPDELSPDPLKVMFSLAAVQGMLDPITPLGRDYLKLLFATGGRLFGYKLTQETQTIFYDAGERLWVNFTPLLQTSFGRKMTRGALSFVEPTVQQALESIENEPQLRPKRSRIRPRSILRLLRFGLPMGLNVILNLLFPNARRRKIIGNSEKVLAQLKTQTHEVHGTQWEKLNQRLELFINIINQYLPHTFLLFISGVASGMASLNILNKLTEEIPEESKNGNGSAPRQNWSNLVMEVTRGLPNNPTTEMDLILWQAAKDLKANALANGEFEQYTASELAAQYASDSLSAASRQTIGDFLEKYGERGLGEIDTGRPRWKEDPSFVIESMQSYMQIKDSKRAPDMVFQRSALSAEAAINQISTGLRHVRGGWFKSRLVRLAAKRVRALLGIRESPKFFMVRLMGLFRQALLESGTEFVQAGELNQADDLIYLTLAEIRRFAAQEQQDWKALIADRRQLYQRELLRRQIPRLLLSDGRAFYDGIKETGTDGQAISGSPVSAGNVEGLVRVVLDPRQANLLPGEILVCPGTDPSWTPLFLTAAGLIMEVGGMMTHGAVVAREYGIPAIVGVDQATRRLHTGQRILMDGSSGRIILLDKENSLTSE
jgi:rifampicin phosphotransferase